MSRDKILSIPPEQLIEDAVGDITCQKHLREYQEQNVLNIWTNSNIV
ncbi:hypothetical protein pb186bvf_011426 [Paramecium bursaria]